MSKKLVSGDRWWRTTDVIAEVMYTWPPDTILIHGDARGADTIARECAVLLGLDHRPYPYLSQYGAAGGPRRNIQMLDENPDIDEVLAFHDNILGVSKGTKHMVREALKRGIPCRLFTSQGDIPIPQELHPKKKP